MEAARVVRLPGLPEVKLVNGNSARVIDATRATKSIRQMSSGPQMSAAHQVPPQFTRTQMSTQPAGRLQAHRYKAPVVAAPTSPASTACATANNCTAATAAAAAAAAASSSSSSCSEILGHVRRLGDQLEEISKQLERFNETLWLMHNNQSEPPPPTNSIPNHHHQHQQHHLAHNRCRSPDQPFYHANYQSNQLHFSHQPSALKHTSTKQPLPTYQQTHSRAPQPTTSRSPQPAPQPVARHFSPAHKYHPKTPQSVENIPSPRKHTTTTLKEPFTLPTFRTTTSLAQKHNSRHSAPVQHYREEPLADVSIASREYLIRNKLQCPQSTNPLDYY